MTHKVYEVVKVKRETANAASIFFKGNFKSEPGQFIMLWMPGVDEKPFAVSHQNKGLFAVTVEEKGQFTKKISKVKQGAKLGVRGPFGNGFKPKDNSIIVAGGLGMAPLIQLIKKIKNSTIIQGAKSKDFLLYLENKELLDVIEKNKNKIIYCTDDGSFGIEGFTPDILKEVIGKTKTVYTCGPEIMMKKVFEVCEKNKIDCEASLERFMRCGFGICGACVCGNQLVCQDGPVFNSEKLRKMKDFGKFAKLKSGKKVTLKEYYGWKSK